MADSEAAAVELGDRALDPDLVAIGAGHAEGGARVHQRNADDAVALHHRGLGHAEGAREQARGGGVEPFEVTRVEYDAGGIAVTPLDNSLARIGEHASSVGRVATSPNAAGRQPPPGPATFAARLATKSASRAAASGPVWAR